MENLTVNLQYIKFDGTNLKDIVKELKTLNETFQVQKIEDADENIQSVNIQFLKNGSGTTRSSLSIKVNDYLVKDNNGYQVYSEGVFKKKFKQNEDNTDNQNNKYDFSRANVYESYYYIQDDSQIRTEEELYLWNNDAMYETANYFPDEPTAEKFNKIQALQRKLLRFSLENGGDKIDWKDNDMKKWYIDCCQQDNILVLDYNYCYHQPNEVYFISKKVAEKAVELFKDEIMEVYNIKW